MISPKAKGEGNAEVRVARSMRAARSIIQILLLCGVCSFGVADVMLLVPYKQELLENGSLEGYLSAKSLMACGLCGMASSFRQGRQTQSLHHNVLRKIFQILRLMASCLSIAGSLKKS